MKVDVSAVELWRDRGLGITSEKWLVRGGDGWRDLPETFLRAVVCAPLVIWHFLF